MRSANPQAEAQGGVENGVHLTLLDDSASHVAGHVSDLSEQVAAREEIAVQHVSELNKGVKGALKGQDGLALALVVIVNHLSGDIIRAGDAGAPGGQFSGLLVAADGGGELVCGLNVHDRDLQSVSTRRIMHGAKAVGSAFLHF